MKYAIKNYRNKTVLVLIAFLATCFSSCKEKEIPMNFPDPEITFEGEAMSIVREAGEHDVPFKANLPWRIKTDADWVTILKDHGAADSISAISVTENTEIEAREAELTIWITSTYEKKLRLIQLGLGKQISASKESLHFENKGGDETLTITANIEWEVATTLPDWINVSREDNLLTITAETNLGNDERTGIVTIQEKDDTTKLEIPVTQDAIGKLIALEYRDTTISTGACELVAAFQTNVAYTITPSEAWITVKTQDEAPQGGTIERKTLTLSVAASTQETPRTAYVYIIGDGAADTLKVTQRSIEVPITTFSTEAFEETLDIEVRGIGNWTYAFEGGQPEWITNITPASPANRNATLVLTLAPNLSNSDRPCTLNITEGNITKVVSITQRTSSSASDLAALKEFYTDMKGAAWTNKWNTEEPFSNAAAWPGLIFEDDRVVGINIVEANNMVGDISALGKLPKLQTIKFKHQKIDSIPSSLGNLRGLTYLWLIECALDGDIPMTLKNCSMIVDFNISNHPTATPAGFDNQVSGGLEMLKGMSALKSFKAYCNKLNGPLPTIEVIDGDPKTMPNLNLLMIYENEIAGPIPYGYGLLFTKNNGLHFRVQDNQLSGKIPDDLKAVSWYAANKDNFILKGNNLTE